MLYELQLEEKTETGKVRRTYRNTRTGSESITEELYTDKLGNVWFGFVDLFKIPYIRMAFSQNISNLFSIGCTKKDLNTWCNSLKTILKSNDQEKYEKAYKEVLNMEALIENTVDPVKQHLGLCTVYVLKADEQIDHFSEQTAHEKLKLWALDMEAQAFFLNWHMNHIASLTETWNSISETVSTLRKMIPDSAHQT